MRRWMLAVATGFVAGTGFARPPRVEDEHLAVAGGLLACAVAPAWFSASGFVAVAR